MPAPRPMPPMPHIGIGGLGAFPEPAPLGGMATIPPSGDINRFEPGIPGKGGCGKWLTAFWLYTTFLLLLLLLERPSALVADADFSVALGEAEVRFRSAAKAASLEKTNSDTIFLTSFEAGGGVADVVSASLLSADLIPDVEESL